MKLVNVILGKIEVCTSRFFAAGVKKMEACKTHLN
jgi:hypothetical protein